MKNLLLTIFILITTTSCQRFISKHLISDKQWGEEQAFVTNCRDQWIYHNLEENVKIKLLYFQNKWSYFPNFFIGTTQGMDTIGLIDHDFQFDDDFALGDSLVFHPGKSRNDTLIGLYTYTPGQYPGFTVSPQRKRNLILCAVKNIYFAEIEE